MQIRARLTLLFMLLAAGILAAVLFVVFWMFKKNTEEAFFKALQSKAEVTAQTILRTGQYLEPLPPDWIAPEDEILPYQDNITIFDNAYNRVFTVRRDAAPVSVRDLQDIYQRGESRFSHFNLLAYGQKAISPVGFTYVVVAEGFCDPKELLELRNILLLSFLFGVMLVAGSGWYYAGKALQPVSNIVQEVGKIQPSDLSRRLHPGENMDEIAKLAATFNLLLDRVERAFQMQKMFVSNVSHELKNPLTAIRAQLDVLLNRERSPAVYQKALISVLEDVKGLSETEQKLLHLARVYTNPESITLEPTRLDELIWQAVEQLKKQYPDYQATFELGGMPEHSEALLVQANEPLLLLALLNLMNNACKYAPDNKVHIRAVFQSDGQHEIDICDNGAGIPDDEKALIFEPFYRSPRHLTIKGTGIGLSLVKSILNLHQVDISVESPSTGGTIFRLFFNPKASL